MKILILEVSCWIFFFFFKSQEDGLGSAENKETAKKMQNQEVKLSAGSQECQFLLTFLLSYLSLFFLVSLLPLSIPSFHKYYGEPTLNKILCQAQAYRCEPKQSLIPWSLGTRDYPYRGVGFFGRVQV